MRFAQFPIGERDFHIWKYKAPEVLTTPNGPNPADGSHWGASFKIAVDFG